MRIIICANCYPVEYAATVLGDQTKGIDLSDPVSSLDIAKGSASSLQHKPLASTIKDEFAAYIRGWTDGAGATKVDTRVIGSQTIDAAYREGYADGRKARSMAHVAASEKYGHKVSVLRVPEKIGPCDQD